MPNSTLRAETHAAARPQNHSHKAHPAAYTVQCFLKEAMEMEEKVTLEQDIDDLIFDESDGGASER